MMTSPIACVVDASVGVKLVLVEVLSNEAHALFSHLAKDPAARFFTPDLFDIECANILWKQVRRFGCPLADAQAASGPTRGAGRSARSGPDAGGRCANDRLLLRD